MINQHERNAVVWTLNRNLILNQYLEEEVKE